MRRLVLLVATITAASAVLLANFQPQRGQDVRRRPRLMATTADRDSAVMRQAAAQSSAARAAAAPEQRETVVTPQQLKAAIDQLGTVDYAVRTSAARTVRRTPAPMA